MNIRIPYITTKPDKDIIITTYLVPLWWVLGLTAIIYHMLCMWLLFKIIVLSSKESKSVSIPKLVIFPSIIIIVYSLSILVNIYGSETSRTIASLYNLSFWFVGIILIVCVHNYFNVQSISEISDAFLVNVAFIGILGLSSLLLWQLGLRRVVFSSPLLLAIPKLETIPLLKQSATIQLLSSDWFASSASPRLSLFNPYPTALAATLILTLPLAYVASSYDKKVKVIIVAMGAFSFILTLSRTSIVAFAIACYIVYLWNLRHRVIIAIILLLILVLLWPIIMIGVEWFSDLRGGSTELRWQMYQYSLETVFNKNPYLGIGVKPRESFSKIPIGSHSMYISVLVRCGLIGLMLFISMQFHIVKKWLDKTHHIESLYEKSIWNALGISLISLCLWLATEDLDAPQLVNYLYFIVIGLLSNLNSLYLKEK